MELKAYTCGGWCCDKEAYPKADVDKVIAEKDAEIQALKQKLMAYGDANACLAKENTDLKLIAESRGTEVAQLKSDIANLQDRLRASEKQNEDLINSASQIMILQDKALASKEGQG